MGPISWWLRFLNHHPITSPPTNQRRIKHPAALPVNLPETQLRSLGFLSMSYWFSSLGLCSRPFSAPYSRSSLLVTVCGAHKLGFGIPILSFQGKLTSEQKVEPRCLSLLPLLMETRHALWSQQSSARSIPGVIWEQSTSPGLSVPPLLSFLWAESQLINSLV